MKAYHVLLLVLWSCFHLAFINYLWEEYAWMSYVDEVKSNFNSWKLIYQLAEYSRFFYAILFPLTFLFFAFSNKGHGYYLIVLDIVILKLTAPTFQTNWPYITRAVIDFGVIFIGRYGLLVHGQDISMTTLFKNLGMQFRGRRDGNVRLGPGRIRVVGRHQAGMVRIGMRDQRRRCRSEGDFHDLFDVYDPELLPRFGHNP